MVRLVVQGQSVPKGGNSVLENEDAWSTSQDRDLLTHRVAVSDGATQASFSREWAALVTDSYTAGADSRGRLLLDLPGRQRAWSHSVAQRPLPWYAEQKARMGSFATLLGVRISAGRQANIGGAGRGRRRAWWRALSIGDSCLFLIRNGVLKRAWPISCSTAFNNRPLLLSSVRPLGTAPSLIGVSETSGRFGPDDSLYLTTDALAQWFLHRREMGARPWEDLEGALETESDFSQLVQTLRNDGMRNDDTTAVRIIIES